MAQSTLTDKGQTTVPQEISEALKIRPRQRLDWEIRADGTAVVRPGQSALALFGSLKPGRRFPGLHEEEEAVRRAIGERAGKKGGR